MSTNHIFDINAASTTKSGLDLRPKPPPSSVTFTSTSLASIPNAPATLSLAHCGCWVGLAAVDGFHVERMAQDEGDLFASAEVGEPVPGEHTFDGDDKIFAVRGDSFEEGVGIRAHVPVDEYRSRLIQDTQVHGACVQVDAAVVLVLSGVESHEGLLLC